MLSSASLGAPAVWRSPLAGSSCGAPVARLGSCERSGRGAARGAGLTASRGGCALAALPQPPFSADPPLPLPAALARSSACGRARRRGWRVPRAADGGAAGEGEPSGPHSGGVAADLAGPGIFGLPQRWILVAAISASFVLCNMDKVNMSVALIPMAVQFGWSGAEKGLVSSAFFWGYALTQVPAGYLASKLGGARVLSAGVALWSLGTLLAPPAAAVALPMLCASRLLVGLGEGVAPSAATALLVQFVPARERARAVSLVWGGLDLGSVVGLLIAPLLIGLAGWQSVFTVFAVLGFAWCAAWPLAQPHASVALVRPRAARSPGAASAQAWIEQWRARLGCAPKPSGPPWRKFFRSPAVWAVVVTHFCFNYGYYTLLAWLPSYFEGALGMDLGASSALSLLPYVAMVAMTPVVGPVADSLVQRGYSVTFVRKLAQGIAFLGPAACMLALAALTPTAQPLSLPGVPGALLGAGLGAGAPPPVALVVSLMSLAFGLSAWSRAGLYCNHQDLSPRYASILLGVSNTAGALPGVLGVWAAGLLLDATGSWSLALFLPTALAQLVGTLVFSLFGSGENQGWDGEEE